MLPWPLPRSGSTHLQTAGCGPSTSLWPTPCAPPSQNLCSPSSSSAPELHMDRRNRSRTPALPTDSVLGAALQTKPLWRRLRAAALAAAATFNLLTNPATALAPSLTSCKANTSTSQSTAKCASAVVLLARLPFCYFCSCAAIYFEVTQVCMLRSHHHESTRSHQNSEVKRGWARLVLG